MNMDATFWATVSLILFILIVMYMKIPEKILKYLDHRSARILKDIEEARHLREEAQQLLAEYQRKRKEAQYEVEVILSAAKREATILAEEAEKKTLEYIARRTSLAEKKIAQAEDQILADIKLMAIDIAMEASERIISHKIKDKEADDLFNKNLLELESSISMT
ncbi:ATP F0F1 synthase subunit B [Candidatus Endowatersipora endosymbiont of Watersipora subatra]|uniref:F0F1 ATP synthase subunit B family protein n=1 Tax=Candidatus Endowatersipora endosymbiont of Watersipora subatra TaxID=3077946 RepID=UPI00312C99EF